MDDFPAKIAELLETFATKVRSMTVDRVRKLAVWVAVGLIVATMALLLGIYLVVGLFRLLAELVGVEPAYLILGGLFVVIGMLLWSRRLPKAAKRAARLKAGATAKKDGND